MNTSRVHLVIHTTQKDPSPIALDRSGRPPCICLRYYIQKTLCELSEQLQNYKQSQVQREITKAQRVPHFLS